MYIHDKNSMYIHRMSFLCDKKYASVIFRTLSQGKLYLTNNFSALFEAK